MNVCVDENTSGWQRATLPPRGPSDAQCTRTEPSQTNLHPVQPRPMSRPSLLALTLSLALACEPSSTGPDASVETRDAHIESADVFVPPGVDAHLATDAHASLDAGFEDIVIDDAMVPPEAALYTLDGTRYGIREITRALDAVTAPDADNVILYVHGRACGGGGEPMKSLAGAMPDMARDYSAVPIMLFWPGSDDSCPLGFPEDRALASGPALAVVLGDLYRDERTHPERRARLHFTLITHSMGSLVLEGASRVAGVERLPPSLFDTVIVNSGASAARGHAAWLSGVHVGALQFVTTNEGDNVLRAAGIGRGTRLGRDVSGETLTPAFTYVDFSANNVNHAYYLIGGQNGAGMTAFYTQAMNGLAFDFATSSGVNAVTMRDGARVYVFNGS